MTEWVYLPWIVLHVHLLITLHVKMYTFFKILLNTISFTIPGTCIYLQYQIKLRLTSKVTLLFPCLWSYSKHSSSLEKFLSELNGFFLRKDAGNSRVALYSLSHGKQRGARKHGAQHSRKHGESTTRNGWGRGESDASCAHHPIHTYMIPLSLLHPHKPIYADQKETLTLTLTLTRGGLNPNHSPNQRGGAAGNWKCRGLWGFVGRAFKEGTVSSQRTK